MRHDDQKEKEQRAGLEELTLETKGLITPPMILVKIPMVDNNGCAPKDETANCW